MCTPLLIAGAALSAGSVAANSAAQSQVADARESAMEAERIRQAGFDKRAGALNAQSQDRYADFGGKQAKRSSKLGEFFEGGAGSVKQGGGPNKAGGVLPGSSSNITVSAERAGMREAGRDASQQAGALGDLRGFGDLLGGIGVDQARDATSIGTLNDFKKGSANVLPMELEAANQQGAGLKLIGDLAGGFGGLGISAGIQGGKLPGFGGATAAAAPKVAGAVAPVAAAAAPRPGLSSLWGAGGVPQGGVGTGGVPGFRSTPYSIWGGR